MATTPSDTVLNTVIDPPGDLLAAAIDSPTAGELVIVETSPTVPPPADLAYVGPQVYVEAPRATLANPIEITLTIDDAILAGASRPDDLAVLRNGVPVNPCNGPERRASPNPCVSALETPDVDHTSLVVYSSRGGYWNLTAPTDAPPTTTTTTSLPGATSTTSTSTSSSTTSSTAPSTTSTSTTTSTSVPGGTSTTTLIPRGRRHLIGGSKLLLRDHPTKPVARRLTLRSYDATALVLGDGSDPSALLIEGGSLRMAAVGGDWFEATYPLEPTGWTFVAPENPRAGVRYRNPAGPITKILFEANGELRVTGKGPLLASTLGTEPDLIMVELQLGSYTYCLEFGGTVQRFRAERTLLRKNALRPLACLSDGIAPSELPAP